MKYILKPPEDEAVCWYLDAETDNLKRTLNAESVAVQKDFTPRKPMPSSMTSLGEVFLSIEGEIDIGAERERLQKELDKTKDALTRARHKLRNPSFVEKAPQEVVDKAKTLTEELADKAQKLERTLEFLS